MICQDITFSVAAAAAAANVAPAAFNPVPSDGLLEVFAVTDPQIAGLTADPTLSVQLGGDVQTTPLITSPIREPEAFSVAGARPAPSISNQMLPRTPVRKGTNVQVLLAGGTGATATGAIRVRFFTADEARAQAAFAA